MTIHAKGEAMAEAVTVLYGTDPRGLPNHSLPEAAAYLRIPRSTLRAWLLGMGAFKPILAVARRAPPTLSFFAWSRLTS